MMARPLHVVVRLPWLGTYLRVLHSSEVAARCCRTGDSKASESTPPRNATPGLELRSQATHKPSYVIEFLQVAQSLSPHYPGQLHAGSTRASELCDDIFPRQRVVGFAAGNGYVALWGLPVAQMAMNVSRPVADSVSGVNRDAVGNELGHCGVRDSLGGELLNPAVPVEQHDPDYVVCGEPGSVRPGLFVGETRRLAHGLDLGHAIAQEVQHQMQHRRLPERLPPASSLPGTAMVSISRRQCSSNWWGSPSESRQKTSRPSLRQLTSPVRRSIFSEYDHLVLGDLQSQRQVTDAQLAGPGRGEQNPRAHRVGQHAQSMNQPW